MCGSVLLGLRFIRPFAVAARVSGFVRLLISGRFFLTSSGLQRGQSSSFERESHGKLLGEKFIRVMFVDLLFGFKLKCLKICCWGFTWISYLSVLLLDFTSEGFLLEGSLFAF